MRMHAAGDLDDADLAEGLKEIRRRLGKIRDGLRQTTEPDPLAEFRDAGDAHQVWAGLSLPRQREVLRRLLKVTLLPAARRGKGFDPDSVRVEPAYGSSALS